MKTEFDSIQGAVAEIEMLSKEGFTSFKCYKQNGLWYCEAKV